MDIIILLATGCGIKTKKGADGNICFLLFPFIVRDPEERSRISIHIGATPQIFVVSPSSSSSSPRQQRPLLLLTLSSPLCLSRDHGPLGAGAVPKLHDRLNHCAAHVAAGESLPGLKRRAIKVRR
ncbi:unnamed protein product [Pleuronectes platessa]|uniref:Uncharacterized protein n=1 Tax=Pleuronectes platessa TaxID=8262 RepID=A0A9N7VIP7_PLEPL|nr:unnamed protein product [Pleuronectes platessa]